MTRPDDIDTATIRDLWAKATPGPWTWDEPDMLAPDPDNDDTAFPYTFVITDCNGVASIGLHDAALIVAAINALPALLDVVDNATTQRADAWDEAYELTTGHPPPDGYNPYRALGGEQHQERQ